MGRPDNSVDEPGLGNDIRGYTVGQCYGQCDSGTRNDQFDRETDARADVWNSFHQDGA